eukprot:COSAG02_NODE_7459_length_3004_cov_2.064028_3_plen_100_part_00
MRRAPQRPDGFWPGWCARTAARRVEWGRGGRDAPVGMRGWQRPGVTLATAVALQVSVGSIPQCCARVDGGCPLQGSQRPLVVRWWLADEPDSGGGPDDV